MAAVLAVGLVAVAAAAVVVTVAVCSHVELLRFLATAFEMMHAVHLDGSGAATE